MSSAPRKTALVLSGGGARGAYEVGVLRYLREELPAGLVKFDILCGTSVGAVNACYLASSLDEPQAQARHLADLWGGLTLERVYKVHGEDVWTLARKMWKAAESVRPEGWRLYDILHPTPLEEMVRAGANWANISANLAKGLFSALAVSTTHIASGRTVVFVQNRSGKLPPWSRDPRTEAREAIIGPEHALASAAIPLLFRAVRIGEEYFFDGSVRQNTPLSPALRLGAEKVLIVSLRHKNEQLTPERLREYPTSPVVMGKVLNALLQDPTEYDLDRLRRFNGMLETGKATFGEDFIPKMNETIATMRGQPYRLVRDLVLRPSRDLALLARPHAERLSATGPGTAPLPTRLLHRIAQSQFLSEADLASYLLFDGAYARDLMDLAMEDTHARREALLEFFAA